MEPTGTTDVASRMAAMEKSLAALEKQVVLQAQQIKDLLAIVAPVQAPQPLSINQQALQLAREGKRAESIALLKAHSKWDSQQRRQNKKLAA